MSSPSLLRRLLKRLCQVLAALTTSSAHRLRFLLFCLRRFLAEICGYSRHIGIISRSSAPGSYAMASASSARFPQMTLPLPLHTRQTTTSATAANTQGVVSSSIPPHTMPVPSTHQQANQPRTSLHAEANNTNGISTCFWPIGATNASDIRYKNRRTVCVVVILHYKSG